MKTFEQSLAATKQIADKLGNPIEPKILDLVAVLRALDYPTRMSCEGHLDWSRGYPWIDFLVAPPAPHERWGEGVWNGLSPEVRKDIHFTMHLKRFALVAALGDFYEQHPVYHYDQQLAVSPIGRPTTKIAGPLPVFELYPMSESFMQIIPDATKRRSREGHLLVMQNQMQAFAEFLKGRLAGYIHQEQEAQSS